MISKRIDHQLRKDIVLGIVVNEYIKTINPVSSNFIAQEYLMDLSPATIRNILAELEQEGYLTHPHTSAGRIPTQEGYRFYVDNLMNEIQLLEDEKHRIESEYMQNVKDLSVVLEKSSQVICDITQYTSIISIDGCRDRVYCKGLGNVLGYVDIKDLNAIRNILLLIEEKEQILDIINCTLEQKINIFIGHEIACKAVEECSLAVSSYRTNQGLSGRIAVLGPTCMNYQKVASALEYFSEFISSI